MSLEIAVDQLQQGVGHGRSIWGLIPFFFSLACRTVRSSAGQWKPGCPTTVGSGCTPGGTAASPAPQELDRSSPATAPTALDDANRVRAAYCHGAGGCLVST